MFYIFQNMVVFLFSSSYFHIVTSFKRINSEVHLNLLLMELTFFIYLILIEFISELKNQELNRRNVQNTDFTQKNPRHLFSLMNQKARHWVMF